MRARWVAHRGMPCCGWAALVLATAGGVGRSVGGEVSGTVNVPGARARDLSRTVVYLDDAESLRKDAANDRGADPAQRPQIVQRNKAFVPDLLVVARGTTVEFPNWDPYSHNVFSRSRAAQFDLDRYGQGQSKSYTFETAGVVQVFCNIHPQMRAVVLVVPNRHFTRADAEGRFTLRDVPPGSHVLVCWHERAGVARQTIEAREAAVRGVTLTLSGETQRETSAAGQRPRRPAGVERGLGVKRERLALPVVPDAHPAPPPAPRP